MPHPIVTLAIAAAVALPAVAADQSFRLEIMADRWAGTADQSDWREAPLPDEPIVGRPLEATRPFTYDGDGWPLLDGWMRGDPTLRHWVVHRFDLDSDGVLTTSEALMARRTFYAIADTNRSDLITSEEFVAGWTSVRGELDRFYAFDVLRASS